MPATPPRAPEQAPRWPLLAVAGAGLVVLLVLAILGSLTISEAAFGGALIAFAAAIVMVLVDRSAEARFQAFLRASAEQADEAPPFSTLISVLPDPILVVSAGEADDFTSRRFIFANPAARELLGVSRSEGLLISATRDPAVLRAVDEALFEGRDAEALHDRGGAQARVLRAYARPLGLALNGRRLALLVFRDETEFHRLERTRVDFLANASHELRTPLASLSGFIETLRGHARDDAAARDRFLGIMQAQAERMRRLIDDLLSLSRIELNEHVAPSGQVDLAGAVSDVLDAAAPIAQEREVRFEVTAPGSALITGDRDQIVQVVQNLVDNALKYSRPGGVVRIGLDAGLNADAAAAGRRADAARLPLLTPDEPYARYVALRVADEGAGIARENLPRLTERFYRVEGQKSGERSGTGLGLAIVKHIANRHRGGLAVESAQGQGTTFTVYFPQAAAPASQAAPAAVVKVS
ncbi:ATP-binding protein [Phenylobacterium sp.]|uniref:ATP-binding protein n=1 Tax=Phenylobacterium sp. TaxID=1871053 RepID=UPI002F9354CE